MKRVPGWIAALLKYAAGILCWAGIFAYLQVQCIFNVGSFVDGLWMRDLHDDLVQNLIGKVAFRASGGYGDYGCGDRYIYTAHYGAGDTDSGSDTRTLTSLVDVATWREVDDPVSITATFLDSKHTYVLYMTSDPAYILAVDR